MTRKGHGVRLSSGVGWMQKHDHLKPSCSELSSCRNLTAVLKERTTNDQTYPTWLSCRRSLAFLHGLVWAIWPWRTRVQLAYLTPWIRITFQFLCFCCCCMPARCQCNTSWYDIWTYRIWMWSVVELGKLVVCTDIFISPSLHQSWCHSRFSTWILLTLDSLCAGRLEAFAFVIAIEPMDTTTFRSESPPI